jgi:predicted DNA-binding protein with PD1-like motif
VTGSLESAEVASYDQAARAWRPARTLTGGFELLSMTGTISEQSGELAVVARAALMRDRDTGVEVVGGHVRRATVFAVELVIDAFDDLVLRRAPDDATGLTTWREVLSADGGIGHGAPPEPAMVEPPAPVVVQSAAPAPVREPIVDIVINPGDLLVHPKFGRVTVMRIEGDHEYVHVQLRNQRVVRLSLDVLSLRALGTEGGQRIFNASVE